MLTDGLGRIGEAASVPDAGAGHLASPVARCSCRTPCSLRATSGFPRDVWHAFRSARHSGDRCRILLRPVTPAASGVLAVAGPGLPVGSQTDKPWRYIDDRCGTAGLQVEGAAAVELAPVAQPVPGPCAAHSGNVAPVHPVLPRPGRAPGGAADTGRLCAACAVTSEPAGKPASCRRQSGALDSDFTSVSEPVVPGRSPPCHHHDDTSGSQRRCAWSAPSPRR